MTSQKGLTGGWTKYGGARKHVIQKQIKNTWCCQACGQERPKEMSPFSYEFMEGEYIRICGPCLNNGVIVLTSRRMSLELRNW